MVYVCLCVGGGARGAGNGKETERGSVFAYGFVGRVYLRGGVEYDCESCVDAVPCTPQLQTERGSQIWVHTLTH